MARPKVENPNKPVSISFSKTTLDLLDEYSKETGIIRSTIVCEAIELLLRNKNFDLTIVSHVEPVDINIYADPNYYFGYDSAEFQNIIKAINDSGDVEETSFFYKLAQRKIADDAVNGYLLQLGKYGVWKRGVRGMWKNYPIRSNDLSDVYIEGADE